MEVFRKITLILLLGGLLLIVSVNGRIPYKPLKDVVPFIVYFRSRYRALCIGTLVSRTAILTAAICCTSPISPSVEINAINVVVGTKYRHTKRGIRVQVLKVIIPILPNDTASRGFILQKAVALLILKRSIPDALAEIPLRAITVNYKATNSDLHLRQQCFTAGWHYFYKGDKIYHPNKFLLQRNLRVQVLDVAKKKTWCDALAKRFQSVLDNIGYGAYYEDVAGVCVIDGMYGAPLICGGQMVAMLTAPDAQWTNCTGMSNIFHLLSSKYTISFMDCVSKFFKPDIKTVEWNRLQKVQVENSKEEFDYIPELYDSMIPDYKASGEM